MGANEFCQIIIIIIIIIIEQNPTRNKTFCQQTSVTATDSKTVQQ